MMVRSLYHKSKVILWIEVVLANVILIGVLWWMDVHDVTYIKDSWFEWFQERHFLVRLPIWMMYLLILWQIIKYWYKLCKWFAMLLVKRFYK